MTTKTPNALQLTYLDGTPFLDFVREFDAPVADVYRAHVEPELVRRWLGPHGYEMRIERYDVRPGGRYRYVHLDPQGGEYGFRGVVHTARENEIIVQTFEFEGFPDVVSLDVVRFEALGDGRTRLVGHSTFPSVEAAAGMVSSGAERGMREGYERLDEVLREASGDAAAS